MLNAIRGKYQNRWWGFIIPPKNKWYPRPEYTRTIKYPDGYTEVFKFRSNVFYEWLFMLVLAMLFFGVLGIVIFMVCTGIDTFP